MLSDTAQGTTNSEQREKPPSTRPSADTTAQEHPSSPTPITYSAPPITALSESAISPARSRFHTAHAPAISRHFTCVQKSTLRHSLLGRLFFPIPPIFCHARYLTTTRHCHAPGLIAIPKTLDTLSGTLLSLPHINSGIFRINTTRENLRDVRSIVNDMAEGHLREERGQELLRSRFDSIDLAGAYQILLEGFNAPLFSSALIGPIKAAYAAGSDRPACIKAVLHALPPLNRRILDNVVFLCRAMMERTKQDRQHLDDRGFGVVIMPSLFFNTVHRCSMEDVMLMVDFTTYLLTDFATLIEDR